MWECDDVNVNVSFWTVSSLSLLFLVIETVKKKRKKNIIIICMWTQQLDDISVSWRCIIPDIPVLAFYSGSKRSHVICLHLGILPLYIICQDIIWNVNLFLQYTVSSESQSLLYIMHITVQVARKLCFFFFFFLHSRVSRVEQTRVITLNPAPQAA